MSSMTAANEKRLYDLLNLFFSVARQANSETAQMLEALDLTGPLANVLWLLDPARQAPSMREVADRLCCDPSSLTFLADRLSERGMLERRPDPDNRRIKRLVLTSRGAEVRRKLIDQTIARTPLAKLSPLDQETLLTLLTRASPPNA